MTNIETEQKKICTNVTFIVFYLILASHFASPPSLDLFGLSLTNLSLSLWTIVKLIAAGLTETSPWFMIFALVPHFLLGFEVEKTLRSLKYTIALFGSVVATNVLTVTMWFVFNASGMTLAQKDFIFASSTPVLILCILCFNLLVPSPLGSLRNIGQIVLWITCTLILIRCFTVASLVAWTRKT